MRDRPEYPMNMTEFAHDIGISVPTLHGWVTNEYVTARKVNPRKPMAEKYIQPDEVMRVRALLEFARSANIKPTPVLAFAHMLRTGKHTPELLAALNPISTETESSDDGEAEQSETENAAVA